MTTGQIARLDYKAQELARLVRELTRQSLVKTAAKHVSKNGNGNGVTPARVLHGRYLGLTRTLPPRQKSKCKALRISKGVRAAIALAKKFRED